MGKPMTENVTKNFQQWVGDAVSVAFTMSNVNVLNAADLAVYLDDAPQTITTDYSVVIAEQIATVSFLAAPAAGTRVTIVREEPLAQNTDLTTINTFRAEGFEGALDTIVRQIYRIWHKLSRSLTLPDSAVDGTGQFDARSNRIGNVADPAAAQDAVTKTYADTTYVLQSASLGDMLKSVYDSNADGKVNAADTADIAPWSGLTGVPASFPPSVHIHTASDVTDFASAADARITASAQSTGVWEAGAGTTESAVSPAKVATAIAALASGGGDMFAATYDPTAVSGDAFSMTNMAEGATNKILTATERTKLSGIETSATADQTGAEIKAAYEVEANAFTDAQFTKLAGIATAATANSSDAVLVARANHTGTQTASTVSDFSSAADARIAADAALVKLTGTQTLTNKTLTDPKITYTANAQTGTTYTLVLTDSSKVVTMSNASANVLTIPANASVAFVVNQSIAVIQLGAGVTTITAASGVTLNGVSAGSGALSNQYAAVTLYKIATDTWIASGGIGTVA
tara:strand:- start:612 stop:2165 length:1554 start_codon:yes stop_codon:yes gene_type:complete